MNAKEYYNQLSTLLSNHQDEARKVAMKAYMRNQFDYYGINSPLRKELLSGFLSEHGKPEIENLQEVSQLLWDDPHREAQYVAMDIMGKMVSKMDDSFLLFLEKLILQKSWWDTVDWLAPSAIGGILKRYPKLIKPLTERYIASDNMWLQRSAILFQLKYKDKTDFKMLTDYILVHASSKEFFIQKASGWALRQYSKFNPIAVIDFIKTYEDQLSNLTIREGLKWVNKNSKT
jgi:3-methyladenine DNA glycosylase AlkD